MTTNTLRKMSLTDLHREHAALGEVLALIPARDTQAYADLSADQRRLADKHRRQYANRRADVREARRCRMEAIADRRAG